MRCFLLLAALTSSLTAISQQGPDTLSRPPAADSGPDSTVAKPIPPCIVVLDFVNASAAPARATRLISERIRLHVLQTRGFRTVDIGHIRKACDKYGTQNPDSMGTEQVSKLGKDLMADYLITGIISYYHEGDIELKKSRIELLGKIFLCRTGEILTIESAKVSSKGDINELASKASRLLTSKLIKKIIK